MQLNSNNSVTSKFSELLHSLNYVADDLKIACAEASLEGDFTRVARLSDSSRYIQLFINEVSELSNRWNKGVHNPVAPKKPGNKHRKSSARRKPRTKLLVNINGQEIQHDTAVNTFVSTLGVMGFDRVAGLKEIFSGIPLLSKTPPSGYQTTKQAGGWFICTNASTQDMKRLLEKLGKQLKIPLQVKILEGRPQ